MTRSERILTVPFAKAAFIVRGQPAGQSGSPLRQCQVVVWHSDTYENSA